MNIKTEIIPVIHFINYNQTLTNVKTCLDLGISKVFLINHQTKSDILIETASRIKETFPDLWVGLNLLDKNIDEVVQSNLSFDGLWCDQTITPEIAQKRKYKGELFTGTAFKYQPQPKDLEKECKKQIHLTDVITTSGIGTGKETDIEKVKNIRNYIENKKLAVASGVNENNIKLYKGTVNYLLVASSITNSFEIIDSYKLKSLLSCL